MSFDRKSYKSAILTALQTVSNRETALLEMLVNEAEQRYNAENKTTYSYVDNTAKIVKNDIWKNDTRRFAGQNDNTHNEYAPFVREDHERVASDRSLKGTTADPDNGPYCTACGHYHCGMC